MSRKPLHATLETALIEAQTKQGADALAAFADIRNRLSADDSAYAYYLRGRVFFLEQKDDLALENYTAALKIDPNLAIASFHCGVLFRYMQKLDLAADRLLQAVNTAPSAVDKARYLLELGHVRKSQDNSQAAMDAYAKSAEVSVSYAALVALGGCQLEIARLAETGAETLERAASLLDGKQAELEHVSGLFNLATYYVTRQLWSKAARPLTIAMSVRGAPDIGVISRLIQVYTALGNVKDRDALVEQLKDFHSKGQVSAPRFCREQVATPQGLVFVFEYFTVSGAFGSPVILMTWGGRQQNMQLPQRTQLGSYDDTTAMCREMGQIGADERMWHCDAYYKDGSHTTLGMFPGKRPSYEQIRDLLLGSLCGTSQEWLSSMQPGKQK